MATYEPHDKFYRKARAMGLPSRAAFKIEEIIARNRLVGKGARVVDLGCAPGGWLAILVVGGGCERARRRRRFAQVKNPPAGAIAIVGDILDPAVTARVQQRARRARRSGDERSRAEADRDCRARRGSIARADRLRAELSRPRC